MKPWRNIFAVLCCVLAVSTTANERADQAYERGMALQQQHRTLEAIKAYREALAIEPEHARAHYELGWSYWTLARWDEVIDHWERALRLKAPYPGLADFLRAARKHKQGEREPLVRVPIGTRAEGLLSSVATADAGAPAAGSRLAATLIARFQHYDPTPAHPDDHFDDAVYSPKSVSFGPAGRKAYINALEGYATVIYDTVALKRIGRIPHRFKEADEALFTRHPGGPAWLNFPPDKKPEQPHRFNGKPVESALSADGRYLWVPYYRRDFDEYGALPSAVSIIDTARDAIVRVMDTGPIPKFVATSPDGATVAVTHWGDNTVGLIDTSGGDVSTYRRTALIPVGRRTDLARIETTDRDHGCGYCLRGTAFTRDGKHLFVGRMGGGGIAVIDVPARRLLRVVQGMRPTPRHLVLSPDGEYLYVSSSLSGYVSVYRAEDLIRAARAGLESLPPLAEIETGPATRTIDISSDGRLLFAAVNHASRLVVLEAPKLKTVLWIPVDSYPVGLAVSPDNRQVWLTSQGRERRGGNSVSVYRLDTQIESSAQASAEK